MSRGRLGAASMGRWALTVFLLLSAVQVGKGQGVPATKPAPVLYDSSYFRAQAGELSLVPECDLPDRPARLPEVLDRYDTLATAKPGCLAKYVARADKVLLQDFEQNADPQDLQWLRLARKQVSKQGVAGRPVVFDPRCSVPVKGDLQYDNLNALLSMLVQQPRQAEAAPPLTGEAILQMVRRSVSLDYMNAQETYAGHWTPFTTPAGPGFRLEAWHLQLIDPDHQWRLFRVTIHAHYDEQGRLHRATAYLLPAGGDYRHHQEYLSTYVWEGEHARVISLSIEPDENVGSGFLRHLRIWEE